jgi:hypothetical protein
VRGRRLAGPAQGRDQPANLFSTRIALRLDESDQVDMVLGDGARDRGALADQISPDPLDRRCGTGLTVVDNGRPVLRAECRLCGYAAAWDSDGDDTGGED